MEQKLEEERIIVRQKQILDNLNTYLSQEEIELLYKAELKEKSLIGPLKDLLTRAKKDVISMCKYLNLVDQSEDMHESLEILADRIRILKQVLLNIERNQKETNVLYYVTDNEGVPYFLRNLELHELTSYNNIYMLLYKIATNNKGKKLFSQNNIDFYYIGNKQLKIVYTETKNCRVVIGIDSTMPPHSIKKNLTNDIIEKIHNIEEQSIHPSFKEIHTTYENVILEALNIKETGYSLTLKRNKE